MAKKTNRVTQLRIWMGQKQAQQLLESEVEGLYEEMDKLGKKSAADVVTDLQLTVINNAISKTKQLLSDDIIIKEVSAFVAAGDNPQYRDVVTVLRQLGQGLERFKKYDYDFLWDDDFSEELEDNSIDESSAIPFFKDVT